MFTSSPNCQHFIAFLLTFLFSASPLPLFSVHPPYCLPSIPPSSCFAPLYPSSLGTAPQGALYTTFRNSDPSMLADKSLSSGHPLHAQPARNPPAPDNAQPNRPLHMLVDTSCSSSCTCASAEKPKELGVVYLKCVDVCVGVLTDTGVFVCDIHSSRSESTHACTSTSMC